MSHMNRLNLALVALMSSVVACGAETADDQGSAEGAVIAPADEGFPGGDEGPCGKAFEAKAMRHSDPREPATTAELVGVKEPKFLYSCTQPKLAKPIAGVTAQGSACVVGGLEKSLFSRKDVRVAAFSLDIDDVSRPGFHSGSFLGDHLVGPTSLAETPDGIALTETTAEPNGNGGSDYSTKVTTTLNRKDRAKVTMNLRIDIKRAKGETNQVNVTYDCRAVP